MKNSILIFSYFFCLNAIYSQEQPMVNAFNREATSLNGYWKYIVDPYENGFYSYRYLPFENDENPAASAFFLNSKRKTKSDLIEYDFDKMDSLKVPGDWNSQKEKLFYYEGSLWYKKSFDYTKKSEDNKVFLYFGASNYETDVYLNGKKLGKHVGGFTPFQFEITHLLNEKQNFVIVKVDNKRKKDAVPTLNTDWWNYGGITRDVKIIETNNTFISDYNIYLNPENNSLIMGSITLNGDAISNKKISLSIPELNIKKELITDNNGKCQFQLTSKNIKYWSPDSPKLYDVIVNTDKDKITDQIGFRTIKTQGADILLNGKSIFLKGISIHEESPINGGRCATQEDAKQLLDYAKQLGCNYVRLAHYPHSEYMVRLADKMGILVWEENPVYWTIAWDNENTYLNAQNQLSEVINRDKNRASVIIWSMANETPNSDTRNNFLTRLVKFTRAKDPTRLISAALEIQNYNDDSNIRTIDDPFADIVDVLSFNQYIGWYEGDIERCKTLKWFISQNKPVMISEFGGGAKYGLHGDKDDRWTEEYQEYLYEETVKMLQQITQLRGMSPWVLVDFKSPRRVLAEIQDNYNRKGLISEKGEKKKAFFALKKYYDSKK